MFIKVTVIDDKGNEFPMIVNTDTIESFRVDENKVNIIYKDRDTDGSEFSHTLKNNIKEIISKLEEANVLAKSQNNGSTGN